MIDIMEMSPGEIQGVIWGDYEDFKTVEEVKVVETGRWHNYYEMVVQQVSTGEFYRIDWEEGATEYQEVDFEPIIVKVFPKEVTQIIYVTDKGK